MCGIAGIYGLEDQERAERLVREMSCSMAHRGPDDDGVFAEPLIALGHRRLAILDLSSAGHQPMFSADGRYCVVYNGEIYNFRDLRAELPGYPFRSDCDTEVILAAYQQWGDDCIKRFTGMFALAIWDRVLGRLFLARDPMGIKPIYYSVQGGVFLFASELRSLLASGLVPRKVNTQSLSEYFVYQTVHAPHTLLQDVRMLMPGHRMIVDAHGIEDQQWWKMSTNAHRPSGKRSLEEVHANVHQLLRASVERRLISDVPFGAFLSGGIDSSLIVALMSEYLSQPAKTFTIVFDESEFNEAHYAAIIAKRFRTDHYELRLKPQDFLADLPNALRAMDHPSGDGPNSYTVSKFTRQAGITMALSGLGGDELFAGYLTFNRMLRLRSQRWFWKLPKSLRVAMASVVYAARPGVRSSKLRQIAQAQEGSVKHTFPISRRVNTSQQISAMLNVPDELRVDRVYQVLGRELDEQADDLPILSQVGIAEMATYMQNVLLRDTDQVSMAVALEVRVPFMDFALVEYVLGVPDAFKRPDYPKKLLVESFPGLLPDEIVHRKKMGFALPWAVWLRGDLREFCDQRIRCLAQRPFIKAEPLLQRWQSYLRGDPQVRWLDMWLCVVLEDWLTRNEIN